MRRTRQIVTAIATTAAAGAAIAALTACGGPTNTQPTVIPHVATTSAPAATTTAAPTTSVESPTPTTQPPTSTRTQQKAATTKPTTAPTRTTISDGSGGYIVMCGPNTICGRSPANQQAHDSWVGGQNQQACKNGYTSLCGVGY